MRKLKPSPAVVAMIILIAGPAVIVFATEPDQRVREDVVTVTAGTVDDADGDTGTATSTTSTTSPVIDSEALEVFVAALREAEAWEFVRRWYEAEQQTKAAAAAAEPQPVGRRSTGGSLPAATTPASGGGSGCVIPAYICQRESGFNYTALNPSSGAGGMYQFLPSTWNSVARQMGKPWLVGVPPHLASPADQDAAAAWLWDGGRGCRHWSAC